jgi:hypothetical protein
MSPAWNHYCSLADQKNPDPVSGINIPDHFSEFRVKNTKILCCGSGIFLILDGIIRIQDKHPGTATLHHWRQLYFTSPKPEFGSSTLCVHNFDTLACGY